MGESNMDELSDDEKIKAFLEIVNSSEKYITRTIYDGVKTFALDVEKNTLFIFDFFEDQFTMDFITSDGIKAISEILKEVDNLDA